MLRTLGNKVKTAVTALYLSNPLGVILVGLLIFFLMFIIIPNLSSIGEMFGIESKATLREKLAIEKDNTADLIEVNKEKSKTIAVINETNKNANAVISDQAVKEQQSEKTKDTVIQKRDVKVAKVISDIKKSTNKRTTIVVDNKKVEADEDQAVSSVHIQALWNAYCSYNPEQCNSQGTGLKS